MERSRKLEHDCVSTVGGQPVRNTPHRRHFYHGKVPVRPGAKGLLLQVVTDTDLPLVCQMHNAQNKATIREAPNLESAYSSFPQVGPWCMFMTLHTSNTRRVNIPEGQLWLLSCFDECSVADQYHEDRAVWVPGMNVCGCLGTYSSYRW